MGGTIRKKFGSESVDKVLNGLKSVVLL